MEDKEYTTNTVGETYNQILKDLDEADTCLINTTIKNRPYRADITAVYLLKSRTYLYMQNWKKAYEYAQKALAKNDNLLDLNLIFRERRRVNQIFPGNHIFHGWTPVSLFHLPTTQIQLRQMGGLPGIHDL